MALAAIIQSLDGLAEAIAKEYAPQPDGTFRLDIDGGFQTTDEAAGLHRALESERKFHKEAAARLKAFDGLEPAKVKEALAAYENLDAEKQALAKDAESKFLARLAPVQKEAEEARTALADIQKKLDEHLVGNTFANATVIAEVCHDGMLPETVRRVLAPYTGIEDGKVIFKDTHGNTLYNAHGVCEANSALRTLLTTTPEGRSLLKPVSGSGMQPGAGAGRSGAVNPWKKDTWNLTEQSILAAKDPETAKRLAASAGAAHAD